MKKILAITAFLCFGFARAQKPAEIGLITDNDLYTSPVNDQYYTAGTTLFYRYLSDKSNDKLAKKIYDFRIGQYIYNPQSVRAEDINVNDRPFAGYLFGEFGINYFYSDESVLKLKVQGGVVGPEAGAEAVQRGLHKVIHYPTVRGWQHQITTTAAAQLGAYYSHKVLGNRFKEKVDFHLLGELNVGTIWNSASIGGMMRISLKRPLEAMYNSSLHNSVLNKDKETYKDHRELFLYLNPNLQYMQYDATIQGSHFNDTSPVTFPLIPFRFNAEVGVKYRYNNWNYSYSFNYRGKELSNNVISGFYYGSIQVSYML
ncbi:lipid A deacylase LpxR family protein [Flavobacterium sp. DG1-102-2]|uniref:lipid A deacylase LpxR family protein n=1 Tax=Flavobacterium sp. DG1-102-2 TaxID=3081663 RepID=UPI00294A889E|nr:lipid A deacylase LpxR family protein [Flavobacterium sp. DG1-102-2]MDV6169200.1 lipid A deacylase LpxR family protein [Flavobacterium sp. DG1-102-2]